jgi:hypothetical protein
MDRSCSPPKASERQKDTDVRTCARRSHLHSLEQGQYQFRAGTATTQLIFLLFVAMKSAKSNAVWTSHSFAAPTSMLQMKFLNASAQVIDRTPNQSNGN